MHAACMHACAPHTLYFFDIRVSESSVRCHSFTWLACSSSGHRAPGPRLSSQGASLHATTGSSLKRS